MEMNTGLKDVKDGDFQVSLGLSLKSYMVQRRFWTALIDRMAFDQKHIRLASLGSRIPWQWYR